MNPLLSVIIPIYNVEKYIEKCLDSLIFQTYRNIEIICVNDGSTDNSLFVLQKMAQYDNRISIINQKNKGQAVARNSGLKKARGRFVTFVDGDDFLDSETYEVSLQYFKENIDVVCFGISVEGDFLLEKRRDDEEYYKIKYSGVVDINSDVILNVDVSPCNKIFRMDVIKKYNVFFPNGIKYEDFSFFCKYFIVSRKAFFIKNKFYHYIRREGSTMSNTFDKSGNLAIDHLYSFRDAYVFASKKSLQNNTMELFERLFAMCFYFSYFNVAKKSRNLVLSESRNMLRELGFNKNDSSLIGCLINSRWSKIEGIKYYTFWQKIFSIRNHNEWKLIRILGIKFKFIRYNFILEMKINQVLLMQDKIIDKVNNLENTVLNCNDDL
ncbi:glycosyltransferase [Akkermansia sp. N21169]|uniref:glycosyltransferase family 2 protein n=1 Tax=Akkermansia sp. N21169 TaxID=3040765 RepID=UPI00244E6C74|nr:glycosyltransferase [Akkermansia sp. N21169]MDH3068338.1 glycosyltransferase [Akkermansia sp. N21169]